MIHYTYLIIGGGMTADAAVGGIRVLDNKGAIGLISNEDDPPYDRPPLTKGLWKDKEIDSIWRNTSDKDVTLHLGREAIQLDPDQHIVTDDEGTEYRYDKLLMATGGRPRQLPFGKEGIIYYRYLRDFRYLHDLAKTHSEFAVIGGGFIGSEIAAALAMNDRNVTIVFPEEGIGGLKFPEDLTKDLNNYYRGKGVEVLSGHMVEEIEQEGDRWILHTDQGNNVNAEVVLVGIGIVPNTKVAEEAGLEVRDGILVDRSLRTSHPDIFAAGDVARFYNAGLGRRLRVEHEDNALTMGEMAGKAMAGEDVDYDYLPYFYSDLFDLGYEAIGTLNPELEVISDWEEPYRKGVIYYLDGGRVRGVLLWNVWGKVDDARQLIYEPGPFKEATLKGHFKNK
jgi:3-phenylpropionate/trans-cinnamate dioxygenase ferredoxin reductase subunit